MSVPQQSADARDPGTGVVYYGKEVALSPELRGLVEMAATEGRIALSALPATVQDHEKIRTVGHSRPPTLSAASYCACWLSFQTSAVC